MKALRVTQISREVPTATRQLPSVALTTVGGGPIAVDPADGQHQRALEVVCQMDVKLPQGTPDHRIGEGRGDRCGDRNVRGCLKPPSPNRNIPAGIRCSVEWHAEKAGVAMTGSHSGRTEAAKAAQIVPAGAI